MTPETLAHAIRRLRTERGLSLASLGGLVFASRQTIWDYEQGRRTPAPEVVDALDRALNAGGRLVQLAAAATTGTGGVPLAGHTWRRADAEGLAQALVGTEPSPDNALAIAHQWLVAEPPQVYELHAGRRIGDDLVDQLEERVHQIRLVDDHVGGQDTSAMVAVELAATAELLREASYTEATGRRLLAVVAELCQIAGWIAADAGRHDPARRLYLAGARAAHAAGDAPGAASNLSSLAYLISNTGDPREAVLLARSAYRGAGPDASAAVRALLLERVAWAHARADEPDEAGLALDRVDDTFADRDPDQDPSWTYWLDRNEIEVMQGRVWTQLRRPLRAVPALEHALAAYGSDAPRETALYLTWLAEALLQAHEVDRAAAETLRADQLAAGAGSDRVHCRVAELRRQLQAHSGQPDVDAVLAATGHIGGT